MQSKVGVLFTDGKGWKYQTEMCCAQHCACVLELRPCQFYQREPGAD